ncbi:MAG: DUF6263 family protein [Gemmatimonadota bacterium]
MRVVVLLATLAHAASAQESVMLRISPRVGDTLHTVLEQQTDVSVTMPGNTSAPAKSMSSTVTIHSQTVVRLVQKGSATVLTTVDSARLTSTDTHASEMTANAQRTLEGQQLLLQLGADGTVESARDIRGALVKREVADAMASMPAVFPKHAVSVGQQWTREMPLPSGGPFGAKGSGRAHATFRLDSLRKNGAVAYVSMHGEIVPDSASQGVEISGSISGSMQLDRVRGWMTDSRFLVIVRSLVVPPTVSGLAPMRFITKVTQRLRTLEKR